MPTELLAALVNPALRHRTAEGEDRWTKFFALPSAEQLNILSREMRLLSGDEKAEIVKLLGPRVKAPFIPLPGPQSDALNSSADELLYGGAAGGGKSALLMGCAALNHKRALILRRQSTELDGLVAELKEMLGRDGWRTEGSGGTHTVGDRVIRLGGCREPDDWRDYAGRARDYLGLDEAGEFLEEQVSSLIAWVRSTDPKQRCRVILASNPPRGAEGEWLVEWFAPWLAPEHPSPARVGEVRWYIRVKSKTRWVKGPGEYQVDGETYTARSRSFIPALLDDNPFLARGDYRATLQNMPEPLRSQLLKGDFLAGREDDAWQVIPSSWVQAARQRWDERRPDTPMTAIGVDVAQGGSDQTVLSPRRGSWFAPLKVHEGIDTTDGPSVAALVVTEMRDGCAIAIDLGGGWGGSAYDHLKQIPELSLIGVVPSEGSSAKTIDGKLGFVNKRAELWWKFREALDPKTGANIALPPDTALSSDLTTPRWKLAARGIQVEAKEEIRKRLGRSPDRGDAAVMSWGCADEHSEARARRMPTHANVGYASVKRYSPQHRQQRANVGYAQGKR